MSTVAAATQVPMSAPEEQRCFLRGVDWETYRKISEALTGRHLRFTYDRGTLQFTTISFRRGCLRGLISQFVIVLTQELGLPICSCGDMTCEREDLDRALEPDESFYIENESLIRAKEEIDLAVDPPPDLAVEVDLRRSPRSRMGTYAAIGMPEVWRFDGENLLIHQRGSDGQYAIVERSPHFPFVSGADLVGFIEQQTQTDETSLVRAFREWVREQLRASEKQS